MSDSSPIVELVAVSKRYGAATGLEPTTLDIETGRTTVLIGPSGCGKTTLLRLMMGLLAPDAGEVRFAEQALHADNVRALRTRMGYVVQDGGLFPHLTAAENVCLMAQHLGWARERQAQRLAELGELVHLSGALMARYPGELSGGQKQRVGFDAGADARSRSCCCSTSRSARSIRWCAPSCRTIWRRSSPRSASRSSW